MSHRRIEVLFFDGCPNVDAAVDRAREASKAAGVPATVTAVRVRDEADAISQRFLGSPTVRVDGIDVDPTASARDDFGLQCRLYTVHGHLEGAPPLAWIAASLQNERPQGEGGPSVLGGCPCNSGGKDPSNT